MTDVDRRSVDMIAGDLGSLLPSWELHLRALNRSPKTLPTYLEAANQMVRFLRDPTPANAETYEVRS